MPYKQKLKDPPALNPRKRATYKVSNWTEYNKSLRKRGCLPSITIAGRRQLRLPVLGCIKHGSQATFHYRSFG
jgi:hypothetical protein